MKRGWVILGAGFGLAVGVVAGPTLFADEPSGKGQTDAPPTEEVLPLQTGTQTTDTKFVEIEPARVYDSRQPGYADRGSLAPNTSRVIYIGDGRDGGGTVTRPNIVPPGATAIAYNVTVTGPTGPNFLAVTPGDSPSFTASAVNFNGTADVANGSIVSIDSSRRIKVWNGDQTGSTHVIIDVTGYFVRPIYAQVNSTGVLRNGSRVVSATRQNTGIYRVKFDRDVLDCAKNLSLGLNEDNSQASAVIDFQMLRQEPDVVTVFTQDNDGVNVLEDRAFSIEVTC